MFILHLLCSVLTVSWIKYIQFVTVTIMKTTSKTTYQVSLTSLICTFSCLNKKCIFGFLSFFRKIVFFFFFFFSFFRVFFFFLKQEFVMNEWEQRLRYSVGKKIKFWKYKIFCEGVKRAELSHEIVAFKMLNLQKKKKSHLICFTFTCTFNFKNNELSSFFFLIRSFNRYTYMYKFVLLYLNAFLFWECWLLQFCYSKYFVNFKMLCIFPEYILWNIHRDYSYIYMVLHIAGKKEK